MTSVTIVIPTFNEESALPATIDALYRLSPRPDEILIADGGSEDATLKVAVEANLSVVNCPRKGRGAQINQGVAQAKGDLICILHADSILPRDAVALIRETMADKGTALSSFFPKLVGERRTRWGSTVHNILKTWYAPLLTRPDLFFRGVRLLFGDHAMFFRREDFLELGGCDERVVVMEEAGLCINFAKLGRTRVLWRWVITSDRRITELGSLRANYNYLKVALMWSMGVREGLAEHYPDIR